MLALDEQPVPTVDGRPDLNLQVALTGVVRGDVLRPACGRSSTTALADAQNGRRRRAARAVRRVLRSAAPTAPTTTRSRRSRRSSAMDTAERLTVRGGRRDRPAVPRRGPSLRRPAPPARTSARSSPPSIDPRVEITGTGAGPILVMGTTGDPATPLAGTRMMADALEDGRLVVVDGRPAHRLRRQRLQSRHRRAVPGRPGRRTHPPTALAAPDLQNADTARR